MRIVFDLDGTLSDLTHRLPLIRQTPPDWRAFFAAVGDDAPIREMVALYQSLQPLHDVEIWSGRSDECLGATVQWLERHAIGGFVSLRMRRAGDHRPDHLVKSEWLQSIPEHLRPQLVFDDRRQVVEMWRQHGIRCCQVAAGDF